jgi:hypothetical protein
LLDPAIDRLSGICGLGIASQNFLATALKSIADAFPLMGYSVSRDVPTEAVISSILGVATKSADFERQMLFAPSLFPPIQVISLRDAWTARSRCSIIESMWSSWIGSFTARKSGALPSTQALIA